MFNVKYNPNVPHTDHHDFIYKEGHKIPKPDNGIRYAYLSKSGKLHTTKYEDDASKYGNGVYAETDEIGNDEGKPIVNGNSYEIWGATENGVYMTVRKDTVKHTTTAHNGNTITVPRGDKRELENLEILRQKYLILEAEVEKHKTQAE